MSTETVELPAVYPHPVRIEWKMLADLRCEFPAFPITDLAKRIGRTPQTLYIWLKQPLYQAYETWVFQQKRAEWTPYERAREADVQEDLQAFSGEMLERLRLIAESTQDEKLQASIAQDWLDRAGYAAQRKMESRTPQILLTAEAVRELLRRDVESRGDVVVGEVVERNVLPSAASA